MIFSDKMNDHVREFQRRARFFKYGTDERTEDDNDADTRKGTGKARADNVCKSLHRFSVGGFHVDERNTGDQTEQQRNAHYRNKGMDFEF